MIYVDSAGHLVTDGPMEELHVFAEKIGLKRTWFQAKKRFPHYDLCMRDLNTGKLVPHKKLIETAFHLGAKVVSSKEIVLVLKRKAEREAAAKQLNRAYKLDCERADDEPL